MPENPSQPKLPRLLVRDDDLTIARVDCKQLCRFSGAGVLADLMMIAWFLCRLRDSRYSKPFRRSLLGVLEPPADFGERRRATDQIAMAASQRIVMTRSVPMSLVSSLRG